jgi:hypothetical protein
MTMKKIVSASPRRTPFDLDIDNLLHPARAFQHPRRVVEDPDLTLNKSLGHLEQLQFFVGFADAAL